MKKSIEIIYAGRSDKRALCLKEILGVSAVYSVGGGFEPPIREVDIVARMKLNHAINRHSDFEDKGRKIVVAADTHTEIQCMDSNGRVYYASKGKPSDESSVRNNFSKMSLVANKLGCAFYRVVSASSAREVGEGRNDEMAQLIQTTIKINKDKLSFLETEEGFEEYLRLFEEFYSTPPYFTNNSPVIDIKKFSGGFSLSVLVSMGLVDSVDGISLGSGQNAFDALKCSILTVACGFGPSILAKIQPEALEAVLAWEWLNKVTEKVLVSFEKNKN